MAVRRCVRMICLPFIIKDLATLLLVLISFRIPAASLPDFVHPLIQGGGPLFLVLTLLATFFWLALYFLPPQYYFLMRLLLARRRYWFARVVASPVARYHWPSPRRHEPSWWLPEAFLEKLVSVSHEPHFLI